MKHIPTCTDASRRPQRCNGSSFRLLASGKREGITVRLGSAERRSPRRLARKGWGEPALRGKATLARRRPSLPRRKRNEAHGVARIIPRPRLPQAAIRVMTHA